MNHLVLATRASPLELWQARWAAALLRRSHPGLQVRLLMVVSSGDRDRTTPLQDSPGVGIFVREIQDAVARGEADAGVHSCKDLPTGIPPGLTLAAVLPRADCRDALIGARALKDLPRGAVIGSSSLRRQLQLQRLRPDLQIQPLRGNVGTRLEAVASGRIAGTVLAMAGLARLGLARRAAAVPLHPVLEMVPAPAQGAVALDCREQDHRTRVLLSAINHRASSSAVAIERAVLQELEGGCSLPLGCLARREAGRWQVVARLLSCGAQGLHAREARYLGPEAGAAQAILRQLLG